MRLAFHKNVPTTTFCELHELIAGAGVLLEKAAFTKGINTVSCDKLLRARDSLAEACRSMEGVVTEAAKKEGIVQLSPWGYSKGPASWTEWYTAAKQKGTGNE